MVDSRRLCTFYYWTSRKFYINYSTLNVKKRYFLYLPRNKKKKKKPRAALVDQAETRTLEILWGHEPPSHSTTPSPRNCTSMKKKSKKTTFDIIVSTQGPFMYLLQEFLTRSHTHGVFTCSFLSCHWNRRRLNVSLFPAFISAFSSTLVEKVERE